MKEFRCSGKLNKLGRCHKLLCKYKINENYLSGKIVLEKDISGLNGFFCVEIKCTKCGKLNKLEV